MKATKKIFYLAFIVVLTLYVSTNVLFNLITGKEIDLINITSIGLIISIAYSLLYYGVISITLKPRYDYLESEELKEPVFGDKLEKVTKIESSSFDFNEIKNKIQKEWIITNSDNQNNIIKYRSKMKFNSWGVGCFLKVENETIKIISFPIAGYTQKGKKLAVEMIDLTEKIIRK